MNIQPIILSGGFGTRLWPLSREKYPKQLLALFNEYSMLQNTVLRLKDFKVENLKKNNPIIVSNQEYRFLIAEQLKQINVCSKILLEPCSRNTAPALTLAALEIVKENQDAIMLVMPADHLIENEVAFHENIQRGIIKAEEGGIICFGITPTRADTGYGYIKTKKNDENSLKLLDKFVEKPNTITAHEYLASGKYVWNSGIFMLKASTWLKAILKFNPLIHSFCKKAFDLSIRDRDFIWIDEGNFKKSPEDSIDYSVMEHLGKDSLAEIESYVIPMTVGWSDVGSWDAVWEQSSKDEFGNVSSNKQDTYFLNSGNNLAFSCNKRLISLLNVNDLIVIDTQDALLIANKSEVANIKQLIGLVKKTHLPLTESGRKVYRPWGSYDSIDIGGNFQVKRIVVNPGEKLSLQMHYHRAEHWIVVKGTGKITKGEDSFLLHENQSVYIPIGTIHRLENPGKLPLELIEVQSGSYLDEDDIVRFDDVYGRKNL